MPHRRSKQSSVHRNLHLSSPPLSGPDVESLQSSLNSLFNHYQFPWREVAADGDYGRRTRNAAKFGAWLIGLSNARIATISADAGRITEEVQRLLRNPQLRDDHDRAREDGRKTKRERLRKSHEDGVHAQLAFLEKHLHVNEDPPESNHGPFPINECQAFFGLSGVPWCGCLAGFAAKKYGGANCDTWFPYAGSIRQDAEAGKNNLHDVNPRLAKKGMIVTFFAGGDDHVGTVREDVKPGDTTIKTYEGNTSSATRDADGGIIEAKERSFSEVTCVAAIEDWG